MIKVHNGFVLLDIKESQLNSYLKSGWKLCEKQKQKKEKKKQYVFDKDGISIIDNDENGITSDVRPKQSRKSNKKD